MDRLKAASILTVNIACASAKANISKAKTEAELRHLALKGLAMATKPDVPDDMVHVAAQFAGQMLVDVFIQHFPNTLLMLEKLDEMAAKMTERLENATTQETRPPS